MALRDLYTCTSRACIAADTSVLTVHVCAMLSRCLVINTLYITINLHIHIHARVYICRFDRLDRGQGKAHMLLCYVFKIALNIIHIQHSYTRGTNCKMATTLFY